MIYDIPQDVIELFELKDKYYYISGKEISNLDNNEMMTMFIDMVGIEEIYQNDGTQIILKHPNYSYLMIINSYGGGDSYDQVFEAYVENYIITNLKILDEL